MCLTLIFANDSMATPYAYLCFHALNSGTKRKIFVQEICQSILNVLRVYMIRDLHFRYIFHIFMCGGDLKHQI